MSYHRFKAEDGSEYGSFEVFALDGSINDDTRQEDGTPYPAGWYWIAGFPGCLWDGEFPNGPFDTEEQAIENARESNL